ncbi:hypothetical protein Pmani_026093 [Petrolisthes manimaculis]|uniref:Uncharacterized protein n=1 Tax=Petrolisthes manimaculis TaxID=1843537 RepID=A0AAE1P457_9EUCA|nr:hypothetical protein Pmani_026093 [Petrolisthes manimaculis]
MHTLSVPGTQLDWAPSHLATRPDQTHLLASSSPHLKPHSHRIEHVCWRRWGEQVNTASVGLVHSSWSGRRRHTHTGVSTRPLQLQS